MNHLSQKLQIAIVADAVYPYNIGGKEKRNYEVSKRLVKKGHTVTIYCMKWWPEESKSVVHEGVRFEALSPYYPLYYKDRRSIKQAIMFSLHAFKLLGKSFDVIDIDHIPQLVLFPLKIVCLLKRKKMIVTLHEVWGSTYWKRYLGNAGYAAYLVEKVTIKFPDIIISGSQHTADKLAKEFGRQQNVYAIPNGIDSRQMDKVKALSGSRDIVFAGRLLSHKNVDMLIHAIKDLHKAYPKISCLIIGNGPEEKALKNLVVSLGLQKHIQFIDFLEDNTDFYSRIKSAKMFILPSSREGFGIATLEAQALGVPVITYDHPDNGSRNLIQEGKNGLLFDKRKRRLTDAIKLLLQKDIPDKTVKSTVEEYDWNNIVKKIENVYTL